MVQKSHRRHRLSLAGVAVATVGLLLTGCGDNGGSASDASTGPVGEVNGTIEYGFWGNAARADVTGAVAKLFEAANPGTTVDMTSAEYLAYIERLTVQSSAGELPCVTQAQSTFLATYADKEVLRPLDDLIAAKTIDVSGIPPEILETGKIDGKQYMIPTGTFLRLLAYNSGLTEQYGIPAPPDKGTFQEFSDWALAAQAKLPAGIYAAENDGANLFTLLSWVEGHGKTMFDGSALGFDQQTLADFFDYWENLRVQGAAIPADRLDEQFSLETAPIAKGQALTATKDIPQVAVTDKTLETQGLPAAVVLVDNPVESGAKTGNVPGTNGLTISANCSNVGTAAAFIDFFNNNPEAAVAYKSANGVAVTETAQQALLDDPNTTPAVKEALTTYQKVTKAGDVATISYPAGYEALQPVLRRAYEDVAFGRASSSDAAANFIAEANQNLS